MTSAQRFDDVKVRSKAYDSTIVLICQGGIFKVFVTSAVGDLQKIVQEP
jgi:hypothetical protein